MVQIELNESQINGGVPIEPTDEYQKKNAGTDKTGKSE